MSSSYSYVTPAHAIQGRNARRPNALAEGAPDPSIDNEVRWLNKVVERKAVAPRQPTFFSREATPGIQAETRGMNWVPDEDSRPLGAAEAVYDDEGNYLGRKNTNLFRKFANAIIDWHCTRAHAVIGGAITSIWTGPAGGQAATAATTAVQDRVCPRINEAASLARQLGIRRLDADRLIREREYVFDAKNGRWVKATPLTLFAMAAQPYVPYLAIGGLVLAVVLATRE